MNELFAKAETNDMELAPTRQRWQHPTATLRLLSQATIICPFCSACGEPQKTDKNGSNPA